MTDAQQPLAQSVAFRFLVLLALHFLLNFGLLPDNVVASHPVHHDDYANLATSMSDVRLLGPRPVSGAAIALVATLGNDLAYLLLNLLVVACVFLSLRFVELFVRGGRALPPLGWVAGGMLAFGFASIVDWTKYFGLLTNLTSALPGLGALCTIAAIDNDARRARLLVPLALVLAAVSFFAKEDFFLPLLLAAACLAIIRRTRLWVMMTVAIAMLFAAALVFNRLAGSVFVSGARSPSDPYYVDLSPVALAWSLGRMLLASAQARMIVAVAFAAVVAAMLVHRRDPPYVLKLLALFAVPFSLLAPNAIFPNHAFAYYAFVPLALLSATLAVAFYSASERPHAGAG